MCGYSRLNIKSSVGTTIAAISLLLSHSADAQVAESGYSLPLSLAVEAATEAIPAANPADSIEETPEPSETVEPVPTTTPTPTPAPTTAAPVDNPWTALLQAGMALVQSLVTPRPTASGTATPVANSLIHRDETSGEQYLRLPVPPPEVLTQVVGALQQLLQGLQGR